MNDFALAINNFQIQSFDHEHCSHPWLTFNSNFYAHEQSGLAI